MASVLSEICLDVNDLDVMERFWSAVLELPPEREDGMTAFVLGGGMSLLLLPVPEAKAVKNRLHLDLSPFRRDQAEELERLLALGATPVDVGQGEDATWHVLADPEGNEFCLLSGRRD